MNIEKKKIIDLSHLLNKDSPKEEMIPRPKFRLLTDYEKNGAFQQIIIMGDHTGTHIDTSRLFYKDGKTPADIDVSQLIGECTLIDISNKNPGDKIELNDIQKEFEKKKGKIEKIVFIRTGMENQVDKKIYSQSWIGLTNNASKYLVSLGIKVIGIDSPCIDCCEIKNYRKSHPELKESDLFPAHATFLKAEVIIIENLKNLDKLPNSFTVVIAPLKLCDCSGSPARVFAFF